MDNVTFELVRPLEADARLILEWRNDPLTRQMSFHQEPKVWESFFSEFLEEYFSFLPPLFIIQNGQRVGFLRFRPIAHPTGLLRQAVDISIQVAPQFRGKGIGAKALIEALIWLKTSDIDDVYAEVKEENKASQKIFEEAGFIKLHEGIKVIENSSYPITRYFAELKPDLPNKPVFIIAEAGSNWRAGSPQEDMARAKKLIDVAKEAGCDAVKFQVFRPETTYVPNAGSSDYLSEQGVNTSMQALFQDLKMPYEMIEVLANYCQQVGIEFMATSFSKQDFAHIDPFVKRHKIASYELGHIHLLELAAKSLKPLILSVGAAIIEEIAWAVSTVRQFHKEGSITLLQCTAKYPAEPSSMHLKTIPWLRKRFNVSVGLSDHSLHPLAAPVTAVALGAKVIEKHFTLDKNLNGPDHAFAVTPQELKNLVTAVREAEMMLGSSVKLIDPSEEELRFFAKRGLQAIQEIKKGDTFKEEENFAILRPGQRRLGIHPKYIRELDGKTSNRHIPLGDGIQMGDF